MYTKKYEVEVNFHLFFVDIRNDKNYLIYIRKEELDGSRKSKCKLFY